MLHSLYREVKKEKVKIYMKTEKIISYTEGSIPYFIEDVEREIEVSKNNKITDIRWEYLENICSAEVLMDELKSKKADKNKENNALEYCIQVMKKALYLVDYDFWFSAMELLVFKYFL